MSDDPWLLSAAEVLDIPVSELERFDANTVVRKDGPITVQTQATDADGIAKGIGDALREKAFATHGLAPPSMVFVPFGGGTLGIPIAALSDGDEPRPGTPICEHVKEIAARLKEIEAERQRDIQAAEKEKS